MTLSAKSQAAFNSWNAETQAIMAADLAAADLAVAASIDRALAQFPHWDFLAGALWRRAGETEEEWQARLLREEHLIQAAREAEDTREARLFATLRARGIDPRLIADMGATMH